MEDQVTIPDVREAIKMAREITPIMNHIDDLLQSSFESVSKRSISRRIAGGRLIPQSSAITEFRHKKTIAYDGLLKLKRVVFV